MREDYLFVSYSSKDKVFVDLIVEKLRDQNVNIWIDDELTGHVGEEWFDIVKDRVCSKYCKGILFFISKSSVVSRQVLKELEYAKAKEVMASHRGKALRILPIESVPDIDQIDEWLYDLRDELEDERDVNENWKEEQIAIDQFREICFPDNNMLRIPFSNDTDVMISHLIETLYSELSTVISDERVSDPFSEDDFQNSSNHGREIKTRKLIQDAIEYQPQKKTFISKEALLHDKTVDISYIRRSNYHIGKTLYTYERGARCYIDKRLEEICFKPLILELASQNAVDFPKRIELYFCNGKCVIGRANLNGNNQADYCFPAEMTFVSRKHLCFELGEKEIFVADLGSINGTSLNGVSLEPQLRHPVTTGDLITISKDNALVYRVVL